MIRDVVIAKHPYAALQMCYLRSWSCPDSDEMPAAEGRPQQLAQKTQGLRGSKGGSAGPYAP